jgi:hypothetical protein
MSCEFIGAEHGIGVSLFLAIAQPGWGSGFGDLPSG